MSYNIDSNKNRLKTNDAVAAAGDVTIESASIRSPVVVVVVVAAAVFG